MTERHTFQSSDCDPAELIIDLVPEHLLAGRSPIQFILTDEVNGPNVITCINFTPKAARKIAAVLTDFANRA